MKNKDEYYELDLNKLEEVMGEDLTEEDKKKLFVYSDTENDGRPNQEDYREISERKKFEFTTCKRSNSVFSWLGARKVD